MSRFLLLLAVALAAAAAAFWTMRDGVGLTNDSRAYLLLADGLTARAAGVPTGDYGLLSRRFPPAFPAVLAAADSLLRVGPLRTARLANVACLVGSTLLLAALVALARRFVPARADAIDPRRPPAVIPARALLAGLLFATASDTLNTHVNLFSEPTFTLWMLLGALAMTAYLRDGRRRWLAAVAGLGALAVLTRYAGVALVAAEAIVVLARSPRARRRERVADATIVATVPAVAMLLWTLGVPQQGAGVGQRDVTFLPVTLERLDQALATFGTWIAWYAPRPAVARTAGVAAIGLFLLLLARPRRALANPALALPWAYCCVYPIFLACSLTFVDTATPLDLRILAPLHAMAVVLACATFAGPPRRLAAIAGVVLVAQVTSTALYLADVRVAGLGYASRRWQDNAMLDVARALPWQAPIFTTGRNVLEFELPTRNVIELPAHPTDGRQLSMDALVLPMLFPIRDAGGRGYLIYFSRPRPTRPFLTPAELAPYFKLQRIANTPDGQVYKIVSVKTRLLPDVRRADPATRATEPADAGE